MTTTSEPMDESMQALGDDEQTTGTLEMTSYTTTVEQAAERFKPALMLASDLALRPLLKCRLS